MTPSQAYIAARQSCALHHAKNLRVLEIAGGDRKKLLHSLLSNDVDGLAPGQGNLAHLLTPKGKVQAACEVLNTATSLLLVCTESSKEVLKKNIVMRIFRSDVQVTDHADRMSVLGIYGPKVSSTLQTIGVETAGLTREYSHTSAASLGEKALVMRVHETGQIGFRLILQTAALDTVSKQIEIAGPAERLDDQTHDVLTMEAGVPAWDVDFSAENFSLEVNLNKAVSNTKGCYLGQEPVARLLSRGHVAQRLAGLVCEGTSPVEKDTPVVFGEKTVGTVTRSVFSPALQKIIANAMLRHDFLEEHEEPKVNVASRAAQVIELPYYQQGEIKFLAGGPRAERVRGPQSRTKPRERGL